MKSGNLSSGGEEHLTRSALMPDLPPANFQNIYRTLADSWRLYDNSGDDAVLTGLEPALRRARLRARATAARTGTPLVIYRNGKIERRMVTRGQKSKA